MKSRFVRTTTFIFAAFAFSSLAVSHCLAQEQSPAELAASVRSKWQVIELETESGSDEWAGSYRSSEGPIVSTILAWSPVSGFIVWWENCSKPISRVNHGGAVFRNDSLTLSPQVAETTPGSLKIPSEFVPVKWDAQHFLIPRDQLMKFVYAVNSNSISELETFLLKAGDSEKKRRGRPAVPPEYARYLGMKPINASVSKLGPPIERWHPHVFLNAGERNGVIPGMKFYHSRGNRFYVLDVISVTEDTSEAAIVFTSGDNIRLKAGSRVSSRAPKGREQYLP
jgi:hypothetical protein